MALGAKENALTSTMQEHDVLFNPVDHFKGVFTKYKMLPLRATVNCKTTITRCSLCLIQAQKARSLYYIRFSFLTGVPF